MRRRVWVLAVIGLSFSLAFLGRHLGWWMGRLDNGVAAIQASGELVVLTRYAPTVFYEDKDERAAGFEHDLALAYARSLGVKVRFVPLDGITAILDTLERGRAHIAAAGLGVTQAREQRLQRSAAYQNIDAQVICRRNGVRPRDMAALASTDLVVARGSSHAEYLQGLRAAHPLQWRESASSVENLLEQVAAGDLACTVADSLTVEINRRYLPELNVAMTLASGQQLAWFMPREATELKQSVDQWLVEMRQSGRLDRLKDKHFGYVDRFDYVDNLAFARSISERLPEMRPLFESAGAEADMPWMLLAAVAYQESHWKSSARSPTGVRGIMMLTQKTAKSLGVTNRLDLAQNLRAGAIYLAQLRTRLPASVAEPDRTWLALAAYNIGYGHVMDARKLAAQLGHDPDTWLGVKHALPMLSNPQYFRRLKHGYARGRAPVHYVSRVRHFEDLLNWHLGSLRNGFVPAIQTASAD